MKSAYSMDTFSSRRELLRYGVAGLSGAAVQGLLSPATAVADEIPPAFGVQFRTFASPDGNASINVLVPPEDEVCSPTMLRSELLHANLLTPELETALQHVTFRPGVVGFEGLPDLEGNSQVIGSVLGGINVIIQTKARRLIGFNETEVFEMKPSGELLTSIPFSQLEGAAAFWLQSGAQAQLINFGPAYFAALHNAGDAGLNVFPEKDCLIGAGLSGAGIALCFASFIALLRALVPFARGALGICRTVPSFLKKCWFLVFGIGAIVALAIALGALIA